MGVLPHVLLLPKEWNNNSMILDKKVSKYTEMLKIFFDNLLKSTSFMTHLKIIYYLDTLPVNVRHVHWHLAPGTKSLVPSIQ